MQSSNIILRSESCETFADIEKITLSPKKEKSSKYDISIGMIVRAVQEQWQSQRPMDRSELENPLVAPAITEIFNDALLLTPWINRSCDRLEKHRADVKYLLKRGIPKDSIAHAFAQDRYLVPLTKFFTNEILALGNPAKDAAAKGTLSKFLNKWLREHTTYRSILKRCKKTAAGRMFTGSYTPFPLRKQTLKSLFIYAENLMKLTYVREKAVFRSPQASIPGAFIAYKNQRCRSNLLHWTGCLQGSNPWLIFQGCFGLVQGISDMSKARKLVLKTSDGKLAAAVDQNIKGIPYDRKTIDKALLNEAYKLIELAPLEGSEGLMSAPLLFIDKKPFVGYVCKRYEGDLIDFFRKLRSLPDLRIRDILGALLNAAKGLQLLRKQKIAHLDLKPDNIFFEFRRVNEDEYKLSFVIADFGMSTTYAALLYNSNTSGYIDSYCLKSDVKRLEKRYRIGDENRTHTLIEQREVYAFGKIVLEVLLGETLQREESKPPNIKIFNVKQVYGKKVYKLVKEMIKEDPKNRLTIDNVVKSFERALNPESEKQKAILNNFFNEATYRQASISSSGEIKII